MGVIILFTILFNIGTWLCHAYLNRACPLVVSDSGVANEDIPNHLCMCIVNSPLLMLNRVSRWIGA